MTGPCDVDVLVLDAPIPGLALTTVEPSIDHGASNAGGWMLLGIMLALTVFELWALHSGRPTISQWVQRKTTGRSWWKAFGIVSIGLLLWHLFEGGPL